MSIGSRIREARKKSGLTQAQLGSKVGMVQATISELETGESAGTTNIASIAHALGVSALWLETGKGSPAPSMPAVKFDQNVAPATLGSRAIPVISAIQAGAMREITIPYSLGDGYATVFVDDSYSQWAFALEIEGDSMLPKFEPGDIVIIEPEWTPRPGEYVAAKNGKQEATFKKYRQRGTDTAGNDIFELVPLNENYPILRSDETPLAIIGVMAEYRQKARKRKI